MKLYVPFAVAFACMLTSAGAGADSNSSSQIAKSELRRMIRDAHTQEQYVVLAKYFRAQQQHFEQEAQAEKVEWIRRSANVSGPAAKYPRPVDSSKNRYEYFSAEANEMDLKASHYEALSANPNSLR